MCHCIVAKIVQNTIITINNNKIQNWANFKSTFTHGHTLETNAKTKTMMTLKYTKANKYIDKWML